MQCTYNLNKPWIEFIETYILKYVMAMHGFITRDCEQCPNSYHSSEFELINGDLLHPNL
jgi:hypothetical protein